MTSPARYQLDGQPMYAKHLARQQGWSVKLIVAAMRDPSPPRTLVDLKAWIVRYLATSRATHRIVRSARRWNGSDPAEAALNKSGTKMPQSGAV